MKILIDLLTTTFTEWQEDKAARLAAALAYYTVFSLAPLVIIVLGIAGFIFGQDMVGDYLLVQVQDLVGESGAEVFQTIIENGNQPSTSLAATAIGIATLLFGATGVFGQLQDALNTVWGVTPKPGQGFLRVIEKRFTSLTMIFGIGFLLLVSLVISAILAGLDSYIQGILPGAVIASHIITFVVSFGVITLLFAMIYKVLPDVDIEWRDVWVGAAATALLFAVGKFALGFYLGRQSFGSTYGAAGSILIILLWVYYSAQILLFGAEFTQVYAKRYGSKIVPDKDAIPLTPDMRARQGIPKVEMVKRIANIKDQQQQVPNAPSDSKVIHSPAQLKPDRFSKILISLFIAAIFIKGLFDSPRKKTLV